MKKVEVEYAGADLESMDLAVNYRSWILDIFRPFLGNRIVEVGAGTGSFSRMLLETDPERLVLVEPSGMFDKLVAEIGRNEHGAEISFYNDIFHNCAGIIKGNGRPDTIVYINVLEHIEDDEKELELILDVIAEGGRLCVFVPAVGFLLSDFDRRIGHFRRYSRQDLIGKCERAGFKIRLARWFDLPGVLPWLIKYRLMRSVTMEHGAVKLYDRTVVPLLRPLENCINPPIGKNLIVVAEK